jgi:hypothetical protein
VIKETKAFKDFKAQRVIQVLRVCLGSEIWEFMMEAIYFWDT